MRTTGRSRSRHSEATITSTTTLLPPLSTRLPLHHLRHTQFQRLDLNHHVYLDYTGSALYPSSLLKHHHRLLETSILGNPHSNNPASDQSTKLVDNAREQVLKFFNADPKKYTVIFTSNASNAIKLVAESFPFTKQSQFLLFADNHNSINGITQYANQSNSSIQYVPLTTNLTINENLLYKSIQKRKKSTSSLFAYPAQSNFSGIKHSLQYAKDARKNGWFVLLDCAAYAPSSKIDLSTIHADFIPISFYKMFGYPTGIGALIARTSSLKILKRPWFSGGTVNFVSTLAQDFQFASIPNQFEDGTVDFLSIASVPYGLNFLNQIGMSKIQQHISLLTNMLIKGLLNLRHATGRSIIYIHGTKNIQQRGGTIALDVLAQDGNRIDADLIEKQAAKQNISIRVGCFCNPGAAEYARRIDQKSLLQCIQQKGLQNCINVQHTAAVRLSLGIANNRADLEKVLRFFKQFARSQSVGMSGLKDKQQQQQQSQNQPSMNKPHQARTKFTTITRAPRNISRRPFILDVQFE